MYVMVPSEKPWQPSVCILEDARNSLPGSYIFVPGLFFIFFLFWLIYGGLGFWGWVLYWVFGVGVFS